MPRQDEKVVLILFTRYPVQGQVKTRLIPALGEQGATLLHAHMTEFTLGQMREVAWRRFCEIRICYTGASVEHMRAWLGEEYVYMEQETGDLGQRMHAAFASAFASGAQKVLLMGSDCPNNRAENIASAIDNLETSPVVFGPALDGGYYLLGLRSLEKSLFENIPWGTAQVLQESMAKVATSHCISSQQDVDYIQDIPEKISVIIPTYNEEARLGKTLQSVLQGFHVEIIVADAASTDGTVDIVQNSQAIFCPCPPEYRGRARQMNYAARQATGAIVLFLHADSLLPAQWDIYVREALACKDICLGFFTFAVTGNFMGKTWLTWGTNIRAKYLQKPYGDQAFFLRTEDFLALGGYADVPILEDVYLAKAAKQRGKHICLDAPVLTSGRRWQEHGFIKTTLFNQAVLVAAAVGMDLYTLRQAYRQGSFWAKKSKTV